MTTDPDERDMPFPFERRAGAERQRRPETPGPDLARALRSGLALSAEAAGMPSAMISTLNRGAHGEVSAVSFGAPKSAFNVPISSARRFAADSWPLARLLAVGKATGTTLNDVVLAMCGGAIRAYLLDLNNLPEESLVSMVPVGLQSRSASSEGGNAVGSVMVKLETQTADAGLRLAAISESMRSGKEALAAMTPAQIVAVSGLGMLPALALPALGVYGVRPFNLVISNVPGSKEVQYFNGARLTDTYPVSIPFNGYALNITCNSYADSMGFGLTGCRRAVPSLQRLLGHLEEELVSLEMAAGVA
jgi:diacylglycerol O-acyltransferase